MSVTATRGSLIGATVQFVIEDCYSCGVLFGIPSDLWNRRLEDHNRFYCPNGHGMSFTGKTEAQKAQEQLAIAQRRLANRDDDLRVERMNHEATTRSLSATRGVLTKTRKRIEHGVCIHCNRTFSDLARHMNIKHADVTL